MDTVLSPSMLQKVGRSVFVCVDLDIIANNMTLLANMCANKSACRVAVVKGNAYGHGAVAVSSYLLARGVADRLAVATVDEAVQLRKAGIEAPIHVLGTIQSWDMPQCIQYGIIPTVCNEAAILAMAKCLHQLKAPHSINNNNQTLSREEKKTNTRTSSPAVGSVHINVDSGMSRYGCQPHEIPRLVEACKKHDVPLEGIMSTFCNLGDSSFSQTQIKTFQRCTEPYRNDGYSFHMANSAAILLNLTTDMDFIRPGTAIYGMSAGFNLDSFIKLGFRPSLSVKGTPAQVKKCRAGTPVGYCCTYKCQSDEWIATFPIGFADGYWRDLGEGKSYIIRDKTGEKCQVVGRVSMDAITVRLPCQPDDYELFTIITADYHPVTSVTGISKRLGTIVNEVLTRLSDRLPRVYRTASGDLHSIVRALDKTCTDSTDNIENDSAIINVIDH